MSAGPDLEGLATEGQSLLVKSSSNNGLSRVQIDSGSYYGSYGEVPWLWSTRIESECEWDFGLRRFVKNLSLQYGTKQLWMIFFVQHILKGFVFTFQNAAQPNFMGAYHISTTQAQKIKNVAALPWCIKPIIGLVSDLVPIRAKRKAPYMVIATVFGVAGYVTMGMCEGAMTFEMMTFSLLAVNFQLSVCDLLSEAKYTEKMGAAPSRATGLAVFMQCGLVVGCLTAQHLLHGLVALMGIRWMLLLLALPAGSVLVPLWLGYLEERNIRGADLTKIRERFWKHREVGTLGLVMVAGSLIIAVCSLVGMSNGHCFWVAAAVAVVVGTTTEVELNPVIGDFTVFSLLNSASSVTLGSSAFYFFTDPPDIYPEGPHFDTQYYGTLVTGISSVMMIGCCILYYKYFLDYGFRGVFLLTNLAATLFALVDMVVFARWNLAVGVPDEIAIFGTTILGNLLDQFGWIPSIVCFAALCPIGMEATMFALFATVNNLGQTIAELGGELLLESLGVNPTGQAGDEEALRHLWIAAAISSVLPTLMVYTFLDFIPDIRPGETVEESGDLFRSNSSEWVFDREPSIEGSFVFEPVLADLDVD